MRDEKRLERERQRSKLMEINAGGKEVQDEMRKEAMRVGEKQRKKMRQEERRGKKQDKRNEIERRAYEMRRGEETRLDEGM